MRWNSHRKRKVHEQFAYIGIEAAEDEHFWIIGILWQWNAELGIWHDGYGGSLESFMEQTEEGYLKWRTKGVYWWMPFDAMCDHFEDQVRSSRRVKP